MSENTENVQQAGADNENTDDLDSNFDQDENEEFKGSTESTTITSSRSERKVQSIMDTDPRSAISHNSVNNLWDDIHMNLEHSFQGIWGMGSNGLSMKMAKDWLALKKRQSFIAEACLQMVEKPKSVILFGKAKDGKVVGKWDTKVFRALPNHSDIITDKRALGELVDDKLDNLQRYHVRKFGSKINMSDPDTKFRISAFANINMTMVKNIAYLGFDRSDTQSHEDWLNKYNEGYEISGFNVEPLKTDDESMRIRKDWVRKCREMESMLK